MTPTIQTNPSTQPGVLAPITRIGGGEVRVDAAAAVSTIAFDSTPGAAEPVLRLPHLDPPTTLERRLTVRNLGERLQLHAHPGLPLRDDQASGAVTPSIAGGGTVTVGRQRGDGHGQAPHRPVEAPGMALHVRAVPDRQRLTSERPSTTATSR